ncbi:Malate dehydrogenase [uncultured delta proteobacterium]|uniref:Malate dehydrogenase n=1 Tax=uncultured delta proteobacterium TaxID=34034 RepID=A0A212K450_9DELT|nr:Malate dehydrogenase [uncultured delta proteobacterium]
MPKKITVIGAGNVGAAVAQYCQLKDLGEIVMLDIAEGVAKGKALDLSQASALQGFDSKIIGTGDYADTANSDVVVVTAGIARKPGMSRDDLIATNLKIVTDVVKAAVAVSPNAIFIIVSNPLDIMCAVAQKVSGLPVERVIGLSGMLDAARLKYYLAEATGVSPRTVNAIVLGEHGDSMVALPRLATIGGVAAPNLLSEAQMAEVAEKTAKGGAAVVALIGVSAWYGPGLSTATMVEAVIKDTHAIMPCSAYLTGQYGAKDMYMCCPIRIGAKGVEEIIEVELNAAEKAAVANSIKSIKEKLAAVK